MGVIGIICNPQSGKDIRRLLSQSTTYDDVDKLNILHRMVSVILSASDEKVIIMPDRYKFGPRLKSLLPPSADKRVEVLDMRAIYSDKDTEEFARQMNAQEASVLVAMGGDGTSRAAAKGVADVPLIAVSTGTNNVYPVPIEGSVVGMAAAALASGYATPDGCTQRSKLLEIWHNGKFRDIALVEAVLTTQQFQGAKAVWDLEAIKRIIAARCHPASIGYSALMGAGSIAGKEDDFGYTAEFSVGRKPNKKVIVAAGTLEKVYMSAPQKILIDTSFSVQTEYSGTLALDGEREIYFQEGDEIEIKLNRRGPLQVSVERALEQAQKCGFFDNSERESNGKRG